VKCFDYGYSNNSINPSLVRLQIQNTRKMTGPSLVIRNKKSRLHKPYHFRNGPLGWLSTPIEDYQGAKSALASNICEDFLILGINRRKAAIGLVFESADDTEAKAVSVETTYQRRMSLPNMDHIPVVIPY
jgi:hypothetical protein